MSDVIEIRDHQPGWIAHQASCAECGKVWTAVFPMECWLGLECPDCHKNSGYSMYKEKQNTEGLFEILKWASKHGWGGYGKMTKANGKKRWNFGGRTFVMDE